MSNEKNPPIERRRYIVERLKEDDAVRVDDIAKKFQCSKHTIQADLSYLRYLGIDVRTRRGVVQPKPSRRANLIRELSFPPEYKEAAISILSYFSRIIEQKYPSIDAKISIAQHGMNVTLTIESDEGELEVVERALTEYGQVVIGQLSPQEFLSDPLAIVELNNRLEIARLELRLKEQSFISHIKQQDGRIASLESQLSKMLTIVGSQLGAVSDLAETISHIANAERISPSVAKAVVALTSIVSLSHSEENERKLRDSLDKIRADAPNLFIKIKATVSSIGNSIAANLATPWVINILSSLPK